LRHFYIHNFDDVNSEILSAHARKKKTSSQLHFFVKPTSH